MPQIKYLMALASISLLSNAYSEVFVEDFTSTDNIDLLSTSARINTATGAGELAAAAGVFSPPFSATSAPKTVVSIPGFDDYAIGDINGDSFPDLFFVDSGDEHYVASGAGGDLSGPVKTVDDPGFDANRTVRIVDFDEDGDQDIFVGFSDTCCSEQRSYFLVNDGSPIFPDGTSTRYLVGAPEEGMRTAEFSDLNGDGLVDMLTQTQINGFSYYINNGTPDAYPESERRDFPDIARFTTFMMIADYNMDGFPDVTVSTGNCCDQYHLFLNTGDPVDPFDQLTGSTYTSTVDARPQTALDMNADGLIDVVGRNRGGSGIFVARNTGAATVFDTDNSDSSFNSSATFLGTLDVNQDGLPDVAGANDQERRIYLNQSDGSFSVANSIDFIPDATRTDFIDVDRDGVVDALVQLQAQSEVLIYIGDDGRSPFLPSAQSIAFGIADDFTTGIAALDVDNDGDTDLLESSNGVNRIHLNQNGTLDSSFAITSDDDDTRAIAAGDFNNDGFADVVAVNNGVNKWYPNDLGDGPFRRAEGGIVIGSSALPSNDVSVVDVDADGLLDLVFANDGVNEIYLNSGAEVPFDATSIAIEIGTQQSDSQSVAAIDVTGDGRLDLIFGNSGVDHWYANDDIGAGFSSASVAQPLGDDATATADVVAVDLNFDTRLDVLLAKPNGPCVWFASAGNEQAFPSTGSGELFSELCAEAISVDVNPVSANEFEVIAGGQSPRYYRVLQANGLANTVGISLTDDIAPTRQLLFSNVSGDSRADVITANFFSVNTIKERPDGIFTGEPGVNRFNLLGNQIRSLPIGTDDGTVNSVSLEIEDDVPQNTSVRYFVSNDGVNYVLAVPDIVVTFDVTGDNLYWYAQLESLSSVVTPTISRIAFSINPADTDEDGIADTVDNCSSAANFDQVDLDNDGFGNRCDADLNNDGIVNVQDLGLLRAVFFSTVPSVADFNTDGVVNAVDLGMMRAAFFQPPGPGAVSDTP